jgi:hypothetical protein
MTEEEADALLDELVIKNPPRVDPSKTRHAVRMVAVDALSADYPDDKNLIRPQNPGGHHQRDGTGTDCNSIITPNAEDSTYLPNRELRPVPP